MKNPGRLRGSDTSDEAGLPEGRASGAPLPSAARYGWGVVHFPRRIEAPEFALRLSRPWDLPALRPLFSTELWIRATGRSDRPFGSLLAFRGWLRGAFDVVYLAECRETGSRRVVGFVGLYDLRPGCSVRLAMAIFDPADRRRGYGKRSMATLCRYLRRKTVVRFIFAEVPRNNAESLAFLKAMKFQVCEQRHGAFILQGHRDIGRASPGQFAPGTLRETVSRVTAPADPAPPRAPGL